MSARSYITFHEYSGFKRSDGSYSEELGDLGIAPATLRALQVASSNIVPGKPVFDFSPAKVRARSLVGVIDVDGTQIEILPKLLSGHGENNQILRNLMFMLSYTNALDVQDAGIAGLSNDFGSFIEAYISIFANRLNRVLTRSGVPKRYEEQSENLDCLKGKINFARNSIVNAVNQSKVFCEFSEFTEDNPVSRALKFVAVALERQTRNVESKRKLQRCIGLLEGTGNAFVEPGQFERMASGRRERDFLALVQLTKMFLERLRPEFGRGNSRRVFALLFDMNELFEEFIFEVLRRNAKNLRVEVRAQKKKRLVTAERNLLDGSDWVDRSLFDTYTDIEIRSPDSGSMMILDTKYKIVGDGSHYGIGNADAYQVLAYKQIHSNEEDLPSVGLLYPKYQKSLWREFRVNGGKQTFFSATIDLSMNFQTDFGVLVNELTRLVQVGLSLGRKDANHAND